METTTYCGKRGCEADEGYGCTGHAQPCAVCGSADDAHAAILDGMARTSDALDRALGEGVADDEDFAHAIDVLAQQRDQARANLERLWDDPYWQGVAHRVSQLHQVAEPKAAKPTCVECDRYFPCPTQRILHGED